MLLIASPFASNNTGPTGHSQGLDCTLVILRHGKTGDTSYMVRSFLGNVPLFCTLEEKFLCIWASPLHNRWDINRPHVMIQKPVIHDSILHILLFQDKLGNSRKTYSRVIKKMFWGFASKYVLQNCSFWQAMRKLLGMSPVARYILTPPPGSFIIITQYNHSVGRRVAAISASVFAILVVVHQK